MGLIYLTIVYIIVKEIKIFLIFKQPVTSSVATRELNICRTNDRYFHLTYSCSTKKIS